MELARATETATIAARLAAAPDDPDATRALHARVDELDQTVTVLLGSDDPAAALRLVAPLSRFCQDHGLVDLGRQIAQRALDGADTAGTDAERAAAWLTLGELAFRQGDQDQARDATQRALEAARRAQDPPAEFDALFNLARIAFRDGDAPRIHAHAQAMLEAAGDDLRKQYGATHMLAWAAHTAGNLDRAVELFERNVEIAHEAGHPLGEASELFNLGALALDAGELDRAAGYLARGLELADELGSAYLLPGLLAEAGRLAVLRGALEPGLQLIAAGERHYELAGLTPDPGDDAFLAQRTQAVEALGASDAGAAVAAGRGLTTEAAVALARDQLGGT